MARRAIQRKAALALAACMLLITATGCELPAEVGAARTAITDEQVPGIQEPHAISWGWPESSWREFTDVQAHAFGVASDQAEGGGTRLYVVEGKDARTSQWRVIYAAKQRLDGQWVTIHITAGTAPSRPVPPTWSSAAAATRNDSAHPVPLSAIGEAAMSGDVTRIEQQLAAGVSVEGPPSDWMTPLMWASARGKEQAVRVLLDSGANANARNEVGVTAIWEAARTGRLSIVEELLAHHADVNARVIPRVGGDTPLMCAANFGHADVARFLVRHEADPRARNAKGQTAAQLAASSGFSALAKWLREKENSPAMGAEDRPEAF